MDRAALDRLPARARRRERQRPSQRLAPPLILEAPAPAFKSDQDVFSHLLFTDEVSIRIDAREVKGQPYTREI